MIYNDIMSYLNVVRRRWWIIVVLFAATMAVILVTNMTAKKVYRAQVKLQVLGSDTQEVYLFSQFKSSDVAGDIRTAQTDFVRQLRNTTVAWQTISDLNLPIGADQLLAGLSVSTDSDFITLVAEASNVDDAEGIATRQAENALAAYRAVRSSPSTEFKDFVDKLLNTQEDDMLKAESAFVAFKQEQSIADMERELLALQDSIRSLRSQADSAQLQQQQYQTRAAKEREQAKALADQAAGMTTAPYSATALKEQAARFTAQANDHDLEAAVYGATVEQLNKEIEQRQNELKDLLSKSISYSALSRNLNQKAGTYDFLVSKRNEAELKEAQAKNMGYIRIIEPASKPSHAEPSKLKQIAMVGAMGSILAGIVIAFGLEFLGSLRKRFIPR